jgi:hypothetical protein
MVSVPIWLIIIITTTFVSVGAYMAKTLLQATITLAVMETQMVEVWRQIADLQAWRHEVENKLVEGT